jgi:hypothetical protein
MSRLPNPGGDDGTWGAILNDFLLISHNNDGSIKTGLVAESQLANSVQTKLNQKADDSSVVHTTGSESVAGVKTFTSSPIVPTPSSNTDAANKLYVDGVVAAGAADASATTKGILKLTGDLGGTAALPTVPGLAGKEPTIAAGTTAQYWRGDKSWQTLDKTAAGLGNVDNTSDATKNSAAATLTNKTISGASNTLSNIPESAVTSLTADLAAKADAAYSLNAQVGTSYTLVLADASKFITLNNASAITLTVPTNASAAFSAGTRIAFAQLGAGQVTVAPAGGVTINADPGLKIAAQYGGAELVKLATDTWLLVGRLSA